MSKKIGRFEIRRELGRGAQSAVYLAWDPQLQREVAIKTLHFSRSDPEQNAMLLSEARAVSNLRHPNIVPIFDAGEQDGDPYLVFEYVEGRSLAEALKADGPMAPARAADLMRQVLDALTEAHSHGIIHRDLKPSNILLDARGMPRVMDFGIAARVSNATSAGEEGLSGTPAYMAPEYVSKQLVSEKVDIFAAGLVLLEMVTGKRYFQGDTTQRILYRVAYEPVELPGGSVVGEQMGDIILKACATDPAMRLSSAAQMKQMLEVYLGSAAQAEGAGEAKKQSTLEFLLRRMRHKSDFPALSDSVSAINKLTDAERESINKLSNTILRDYALTNKILRLVNSAYYRQAGGGNISTVSRAIIVLGFNAIRNIAVTVLLFEHLQDKANAKELKEAFLRVNLAGLLSRDASLRLIPRDAEEGFICALFHGLGQLLAQFYFPEEVDQIRKLMQQQKHLTEAAASTQILGLSFEELGIGIAETWGFPSAIINSMRHLPPGAVRRPATPEATMRVISGFSNEVCEAIASSAPADRSKAIKNLVARFGPSIEISEKQLQASMAKSMEDLAQVASILHLNLKQSAFARQALAFSGKPLPGADAAGGKDDATIVQTILGETAVLGDSDIAEGRSASGDDAHEIAQSVLTAGIQDISNSLVEDFALNDILRIILETMYRAMGFRRVLLCIKDAKTGMMTGRFGFGPDTAEVAKTFRFPVAYTPDVFHLSVSKGVDIIITDIDDPKIADRVPAWYRERVSARTFVLFPLTIKNNPVALIYCDNEKAGSIQIPEKELTLLKTLRNQAVLAIKQSM